MDYVYIIGVLVIVGAIEIVPLYLIASHEVKYKKNFFYFHLLINVIFITWSLYDINFGYHYPHGPNSLVLIMPAWPALMVFYAFVYHKKLPNKKTKILSYALASIYLTGSIIGLINEL